MAEYQLSEHREVGAALAAISTDQGTTPVIVTDAHLAPPRNLRDMIYRSVSAPDLQGLSWIALTSRGIGMDDGEPVDYTVYPEGPFLPPYKSPRAAMSWIGGMVVLNPELSVEIEPRHDASLDTLAARWWASGHPTYVSPQLRPIALTSSRRSDPKAQPRIAEARLSQILDLARSRPSITVAVRTMGNRGYLLARNLDSLIAAHAVSRIDHVIVVTGPLTPVPEIAAATDRGLDISVLEVEPIQRVPGRTRALVAAVEHAATDYIWFVDDDDMVHSDSVLQIRNAVHSARRPIIVGPTAAFEEVWVPGSPTPESRQEIRAHNPGDWAQIFAGWNPLANCSTVLPVAEARAAVGEVPMRNDLGEDFALLLLLLTTPGLDVRVLRHRIAEISVRGIGQNTITMEDRLQWQQSMAAFTEDLVWHHREARIAALWELGAVVRATYEEGSPAWKRLAWRLFPHRIRAAVKDLVARLGGEDAGRATIHDQRGTGREPTLGEE